MTSMEQRRERDSEEPSSFHPVTLVTFDVDGTLVRGSSSVQHATIHAKAFLHAVGKVVNGDSRFEEAYSTPMDIIPAHNYHGCTDGLISLHLAKHAFNVPADKAATMLPAIFDCMHEYVLQATDEEIRDTIEPIDGVLEALSSLADSPLAKHLMCGLVTGNVEGIARKKMRATRILHTGILARASQGQLEKTWRGMEDCSFLGGFGSDYCSNDTSDVSRQFKDRGEQIALAFRRAKELLTAQQRIVRVVHVGDAPADVLAAKYCADEQRFGSGVATSCVAVATGAFSAGELEEVCGEARTGVWEPTVLHGGIPDTGFVDALRIQTTISQ